MQDPWKITSEERSKHDAQFFSLKPVGGFVTGDQAKGFFLQSGLPAPVLMHIWSLADMNGDGKMDKKEFSIACHLISAKLKGLELPKTLPASLKADPVPTIGSFGVGPLPSSGAVVMGTMPAISSQPLVSMGSLSSTMNRPQYNTVPMANGGPTWGPMPVTGAVPPVAPLAGVTPVPPVVPLASVVPVVPVTPAVPVVAVPTSVQGTPTKTASAQSSAASGEWGVSHTQKLKYTQQFNAHDPKRTGYLSGVEAKSVLQQTGLPHAVLAQIWSLADIDNDGRLTNEEFCLAMHLVDMAKSGQPIPQKLPPNLIPPSYRRGPPPGGAVGLPPGGLNAPNVALPVSPIPETFEDKRKENFDKGQAELEKRRAQLQEQLKKQEEERLAHERAEQEKQERIRQEQERKRQMELEKQLEKQRAAEQEREEQRRKAMEQREAARRELERHRQLEWERQCRDQLLMEKQREEGQLERLRIECGELNLELEALDNKKSEVKHRIEQARSTVKDFTSVIEKMRDTRDRKLAEIQTFGKQIEDLQQKLNLLTQQKHQLKVQIQAENHTVDDTYKSVMHSYNNKKATIEKHKNELKQLESDTAARLEEIDKINVESKQFENNIYSLEVVNKQLELKLKQKQTEYKDSKKKKQEKPARPPAITPTPMSEPAKASDQQVSPTPVAAKDEDPWAKFDAEKAANPVIISGPSLSISATTATESDEPVVYKKHRAAFQFDARHEDELSLAPGEIIWVKPNHPGAEPGWALGIREDGSAEGWFPEAYAEELPDDGSYPSFVKSTEPNVFTFPDPVTNVQASDKVMSPPGEQPTTEPNANPESQLDADNIYENINEITSAQAPSSLPQSDQSSFTAVPMSGSPTPGQGQAAPEGLKVQATIMWRAKRDNHLSFDKGDIITVHEQQDNWWCGELNNKVGWFPKSFVKVIGDSMTSKEENQNAVANGTSTPVPDIQEPSPVTDTQTTSNQDTTAGIVDPPEQYIAIYTYSSAEPGDLNFTQNEVITVTKKEADWWTGSIDDRTGIFPANYVKKLETVPAQKTSKTREIASVIAPYQATGPEQLSLQVGQLISVRKKNPSGWWEGELHARGQKRKIGWFPANYVTLLSSGSRGTPSENRKSLSPTPYADGGSRSSTPVSYPQPTAAPSLEQVVAQYSYTAQHADELSFEKNAIINVINKDDPDWWKGELNGQEGMFPANYVTPLTQNVDATTSSTLTSSTYSGNEHKRQSAICELIQTEELYLADLKLVYEVFYKPMAAEKILSQDELEAVFVNWRELIMCNRKLLMALKVRKKTNKGQNISYIGDILCENLPHMTPYIRFCSCQLNATTILHEKLEKDAKFRELHKKCSQDPRVMGMPLSSYYLKPMQRVTRYPMLIEKILRHTSPNHVDHTMLSEAHSKATELCNQVNEGVREKENSDKLEWIQMHVICDGLPEKITFNSVTNCLGPRKYLYSGSLYKHKSGKELVGFLFNDFLLLAQPQRPIGQMADVFSFDVKANVQFKMYRYPLFLNEVTVRKPPNPETESTLFIVLHTEKEYNLKAISIPERDTWVKKIEEASKFYKDTERKRKEKAHSVKQAQNVGRLLVIILEGCNLITGDNGKSDPYCEVNMGVQEHRTKVITGTLNPKWNHSMQFTIKNLDEDVLCITVYDRDLFSPNDFLGRTEIRIRDIIEETKEKKGPLVKRLKLYEVESGEVVVKLDLQIFEKTF